MVRSQSGPAQFSDLNNAVSDAPRGKMPQATIHAHIKSHWVAAGKPKLDKMPEWLTGISPQSKPDPNGVNPSLGQANSARNKPRNRTVKPYALTYGDERLYTDAPLETRSAGHNAATLSGLVIRKNVDYNVQDSQGKFAECMRDSIMQGCDTSDTALLLNHDGVPYARTSTACLS